MAKQQPVQINQTPNNNFNDNLDKKASNHVFYGACTLFVAMLGWLFNHVIELNEKQTEKLSSITERLTRIEAKTERADSINDRVVRLETQIKALKPNTNA